MQTVKQITDKILETIGILHRDSKSGTGIMWMRIPSRPVIVIRARPP